VIDHPSGGFETVRAQRNATQRNDFSLFLSLFRISTRFCKAGIVDGFRYDTAPQWSHPRVAGTKHMIWPGILILQVMKRTEW
jgi:hypothetical protein